MDTAVRSIAAYISLSVLFNIIPIIQFFTTHAAIPDRCKGFSSSLWTYVRKMLVKRGRRPRKAEENRKLNVVATFLRPLDIWRAQCRRKGMRLKSDHMFPWLNLCSLQYYHLCNDPTLD